MQFAQCLRELLDGAGLELVHGGEREQRVAEVAHDAGIAVALLDVIFDGVDDAGEMAEPIKTEAGESPLQRGGQAGRAVVVAATQGLAEVAGAEEVVHGGSSLGV